MSIFHLVAFLAVVFYGLLSPIGKKVLVGGVDQFVYIGCSMAMLSFFAFMAALIKGGGRINFDNIMTGDNLPLIALMAFLNFIGFTLYTISIQKIDVFEYQLMNMIQPIVGAFLAYLLFREHLELKHFIGFALAGVGLYVAIR